MYANDIGIMYAGQLVEYGTREEVFEAPIHPYTKALLASYPTLTGRKSALRPIPGEAPNLITPPPGCRFCDRCSEATASCRAERQVWVDISPQHKSLCCRCRFMIKDCEPILDLRHVTKVYKTKGSLFGARSEDVVALNDISLTLFRGEIFGLVGESGSGKTTWGAWW